MVSADGTSCVFFSLPFEKSPDAADVVCGVGEGWIAPGPQTNLLVHAAGQERPRNRAAGGDKPRPRLGKGQIFRTLRRRYPPTSRERGIKPPSYPLKQAGGFIPVAASDTSPPL